jgi:hypothetical protein
MKDQTTRSAIIERDMVHGEFWLSNDETMGHKSRIRVLMSWCYTGFGVVLQSGEAIIFIAIHVIVSRDSGSADPITSKFYIEFDISNSNPKHQTTPLPSHSPETQRDVSLKHPYPLMQIDPGTGFHPDPHIEFPNTIITSSHHLKAYISSPPSKS